MKGRPAVHPSRTWVTHVTDQLAAFANHLGGDIIIGVDDVDDCASGWNPIPESEIASSVEKISNLLTDIIRPREFAAGVDITPVRAPGANHSAIVVSVPRPPNWRRKRNQIQISPSQWKENTVAYIREPSEAMLANSQCRFRRKAIDA